MSILFLLFQPAYSNPEMSLESASNTGSAICYYIRSFKPNRKVALLYAQG
jgi:hypothetical protein